MNQTRTKTVVFTLIGFYLVVVLRLFYWQIIKNPELNQKIINQTYKPEVIPATRGKIFDSLGAPLALNQTFFHLSIYKPDLKLKPENIISTITAVHHFSDDDTNSINKFLVNSSQKWLSLKDNFTNDEISQIKDPGLTFSPTITRYYPEGALAKNILGFTILDQYGQIQPIGGLESFYQRQLQGKSGFQWESKDATGKTILTKAGWRIDTIEGRDLHTSINRQIQYQVETALQDGIAKYTADSGSITIMRPSDGAIIAMSSFTATQSATPSATYRNPVIADLFEPGSIFKPLVMSMALDKHTINPDWICTKCGSPHQIGQYSITNWDNELHANTDLKDIIKNSDNIGMSYIIQTLGLNNFLHYYQLLGLNRKTGIDLQGEVRALPKTVWPEIDLATASFGQGLAVTQIQMLQAFNTIANNGVMTPAHLVEYYDDNGHKVTPKLPDNTDVYQLNTVNTVKTFLKYGVDNGVVAHFNSGHLDVCAKSGTAQVAINGDYSNNSTNASYIGFSPCQNPKFTMIVTINNPKSSPWGSSTAAPIWYDLAAKLQSLL